MQLAFELSRERNPSVVAHDRRSKLAKTREEVTTKTQEFNHWATEADKHIEHKVIRVAAARHVYIPVRTDHARFLSVLMGIIRRARRRACERVHVLKLDPVYAKLVQSPNFARGARVTPASW